VAHNIEFDEHIIGAELLRTKLASPFAAAQKICTMKSSAAYCRIPNGRGGYKWPNLTELYTNLFQTGFPEAHDALVDVKACADCFFELKRKGVV
jgi:DNA polymerase III epsilon subunit-like protein